jgi:hypothetical protein
VRKADRRVAKQLASPERGIYEPPDRRECSLSQWESPYDDANTVRLQFLLWRKAGRLAEFVVNVQVLTSEGWDTVEYFDCCHGHCHLHPKSGEDPRSIMRLDGIDDVQRALVQVEAEAHSRARIMRGEGA